MGHGMQGFNRSRIPLFATPIMPTNGHSAPYGCSNLRRRYDDMNGRLDSDQGALDDARIWSKLMPLSSKAIQS